ncbi:MAG: hypothetical protein OXG55_00265 [bacterium]|nr:hypothetical protein [bacterium]
MVLARYYNNPKFFVSDGAIGCTKLWAIRADLDRDDFVVVYIGDLGEYLPSRERQYWVPHNVVPEGGISETTYRRHFLSEPAPAQAVDHRFLSLYERVNVRWSDIYGWPLFRPPHPEDRQIMRIHVPLDDNSPAEFDEMILALTKLLIDYLNKRDIANSLEETVADEGSIATLQRWMRANGYPDADRDIMYLKTLQSWRSTGAAHGKGSGFDKLRAATDGSRKDTVTDLLGQANLMLESLSTFLASAKTP